MRLHSTEMADFIIDMLITIVENRHLFDGCSLILHIHMGINGNNIGQQVFNSDS